MTKNFVRLRKACAEHSRLYTGSAEARDSLISGFLDELSAVVHDEYIDSMEDHRLHSLHYYWVKAIGDGLSESDRHKWMINSLVFFPSTAKVAEDSEEQPSNVVSLHG